MTPLRTGTLGGRPADHPRSAGAQPQGRLARPAARLAHRLHRPVGLRQVEPGLRHDLRRGTASLRRVALGLRPPVPGPDGQARRRLHRGPEPCGLDRPEVHLEEPSLDGRHDHRGLRLPAAALRPRGPAALPAVRRADLAADAAADRRPGDGAGGGHALPGAGAGDPRPQGGVRRPLPPAADAGLQPGAGRRRDLSADRAPDPRQAEEAHDRGRRRPDRGQGVGQASAHRLGGDRAQPRRRTGAARLRRPPGRRPAPRAAVLRADGLPQRAPPGDRRARAPLVLLQLALRRLRGVPRPGHPHGGRPGARGHRPGRHPGRGRDRAVDRCPPRRLLPGAARRAR